MKIDAEVLAIAAIALVPTENDDPATLIASCARVTAATLSRSLQVRDLPYATTDVIQEYALRVGTSPAVQQALMLITAACDEDVNLLDSLASDFGALDEGLLDTFAAIVAGSLEAIRLSEGTNPELTFRGVLEGLGS